MSDDDRYKEKSEAGSWYNNIWIFIIVSIILVLTVISLEYKLEAKTVYVLTKSNESILMSEGIDHSLS